MFLYYKNTCLGLRHPQTPAIAPLNKIQMARAKKALRKGAPSIFSC